MRERTPTHLKRVEGILNPDCGKRQVGFYECLVHGKHGVCDLIDDITGILPNLNGIVSKVLHDH